MSSNLFYVADTKTPAEAALAIVSAIARQVEAFEKQLEALDKAEKTQKSVHGLSATPSFKSSQDGRVVPRVSRDVFKQLARIKKSESFISTADAGDPAKRIKTVGKANDVVAGKDLPLESTEKGAADLSKVMGMGGAPAAPAPKKKPLNTAANPGNPNAKVNMGNAFNSLNTPAQKSADDPSKAPLEKVMGMGGAPAAPASVKKPVNTNANPGNPNAKVNMSNAFNSLSAPPVKKETPDMSKPPAGPKNPAPSPQGAVASPTPKAPKAPAPGAQKSEPGVFGKIKKCGQTMVAAKGVK